MFYLSNEPLNANVCQDVAQRQGEDPHEACRNGLFVSADWEVYVDGEPITIYGTPVTRGGPHSFGRADFREGERRSVVIKPQKRKISSVLVAPKHLGVEVELADNEMHFEIDRECHLTFTVNEDIAPQQFFWEGDKYVLGNTSAEDVGNGTGKLSDSYDLSGYVTYENWKKE